MDGFPMFLQCFPTLADLSTSVTGLIFVLLDVRFQADVVSEASNTQMAPKGFPLDVSSLQVTIENGLRREHFGTIITLNALFGVLERVICQHVSRSEACRAVGTLVGFLPGMRPEMSYEATLGHERRIAHFTVEVSDTGVDLLVVFEASSRFVKLSANTASQVGVRSFVRVVSQWFIVF